MGQNSRFKKRFAICVPSPYSKGLSPAVAPPALPDRCPCDGIVMNCQSNHVNGGLGPKVGLDRIRPQAVELSNRFDIWHGPFCPSPSNRLAHHTTRPSSGGFT